MDKEEAARLCTAADEETSTAPDVLDKCTPCALGIMILVALLTFIGAIVCN